MKGPSPNIDFCREAGWQPYPLMTSFTVRHSCYFVLTVIMFSPVLSTIGRMHLGFCSCR